MKIFIRLLLTLVISLSFISLYAQAPAKAKIHREAKFAQWEQAIQSPDVFFQNQQKAWGLTTDDEFRLQSRIEDISGKQSHKFQQYHKQLPVVGAEYILHYAEGELEKSNGQIFPHIDCPTSPALSGELAKQKARSTVLKYMQHAKKYDIELHAIEVEDSRLCILDRAFPSFSGNYALAYEFHLKSNQGLPIHEVVYIDAMDASPIYRYSEICSHNIPSPASGFHYRDVTIPVDSVGPELYQLRDSSRNIQINRVIGGGRFNPETEIVSNTDNNWIYEERDLDGAATDAMYASVAYYEFLKDHFNRTSIDDEGGPLICNVNVPGFDGGFFYVNAFWNGTSSSYGAGDCDNFGPLTTLSIVSHEFTHGLTDYTSDLVYAEESGAINESMSDIFGETLEYMRDSANFSWVIGSKALLPESTRDPIRDMSDPNSLGDPKFYRGMFWDPGQAVHTNSGVMNHWYYLIANGDSGVNEVGDTFNIEGMGIEKAIQIPYLMQTSYLTSTSDYSMAYESSISAAEDLYGPASDEVQMVIDAWRAVGVGETTEITDNLAVYFSSSSFFAQVCLDEEEIILDLTVENNGGDSLLLDQDLLFDLQLGYDFNPIFMDTFAVNLDTLLAPGGTAPFTAVVSHQGGIDPNRLGSIENLEITLLRNDDLNSDNISQTFAEFVNVDIDLAILQANPRYSGQNCEEEKISDIELILENRSCTPIPVGSTITYELHAGSEVYTDQTELFLELEPGGLEFQNINIPEDVFADYYGTVDFNIRLAEDQLTFNDTVQLQTWQQRPLQSEILDFTEDNEDAYLRLQGQQSEPVDYQGDKWLAFKDLSPEFLDYTTCYDGIEEHFELNGTSQGLVELCVDTREMNSPRFSFDAVLFDAYNQSSEIPEHFATIFEVIIEDERKALIYEQEDGSVESYAFELPQDYVGTVQINVSIFRREGASNHDLGTGSWILFDNIRLEEASSALDPPLNALSIYPNPVSGSLYLNMDNQAAQVDLKIYDILGKLILSREGHGIGNPINIRALAEGTYFLQVVDEEDAVHSRQFVVQRP